MNPLSDARKELAELDQQYPPNLLKQPMHKNVMPYEPAAPHAIVARRRALLQEIRRLERAAGMRSKTSIHAHST